MSLLHRFAKSKLKKHPAPATGASRDTLMSGTGSDMRRSQTACTTIPETSDKTARPIVPLRANISKVGGKVWVLNYIIAQVYRLSAVHCQMTRYPQRVPGYLTRYSVSANEISFDKKNQPIRLCLSNQVRPGREWFPSPLGDFNRLFEGLIGELFKIWHWNMFYFLNDISLAPKM